MSPAAAPAPPGPEAPAEGVDDGGRGQHETADGQRDPVEFFPIPKSTSFNPAKKFRLVGSFLEIIDPVLLKEI